MRGRALVTARRIADEVRELGLREAPTARDVPAWARTVNEDELARAVAAGIMVAGHSWSHACLAALEGTNLEQEVAAPMTWLRERFPSAFLPYLAYPYGLVSPAAEAAALRAGCRAAFLSSGGYLPAGAPSSSRLPRLNAPSGVSRAGFALRAAGLLAR